MNACVSPEKNYSLPVLVRTGCPGRGPVRFSCIFENQLFVEQPRRKCHRNDKGGLGDPALKSGRVEQFKGTQVGGVDYGIDQGEADNPAVVVRAEYEFSEGVEVEEHTQDICDKQGQGVSGAKCQAGKKNAIPEESVESAYQKKADEFMGEGVF